jgi:hypothetical protein
MDGMQEARGSSPLAPHFRRSGTCFDLGNHLGVLATQQVAKARVPCPAEVYAGQKVVACPAYGCAAGLCSRTAKLAAIRVIRGAPAGLVVSSSAQQCSPISVNLKNLQSRRAERQIADSARVVTMPKAELMARRLSCSAWPATALQGFPARPAPAPDSAGCSDRSRAAVWLCRGGCRRPPRSRDQ